MSTESNYSFTTKYNGDLLTVRGDTIDEFYSNAIQLASHGDVFHVLGKVQSGTVPQPFQSAPAQVYAPADAPAPWDQPTQQAIQNVQAQIPAAQVVQQQPAFAPNVTSSPGQGYPSGVNTLAPATGMRQVAGKFGQVWTYDVPGAPQGQYGPMVQLQGARKDGSPYTCWAEQPEGPEWKGGKPDYAALKQLRKYNN